MTTATPENSAQAAAASEPVVAPALPYTLHASLKEYRRRLGVVRILAALAITAFFYFRFGFVVWVLSVIGLAVLIIGILLILSKRTVTVSTEGVEFKNAFGKRRLVRYDEIDGVKVFVNYYEPSFGMIPRVSIAIKGDKPPIVLVGMYWPVDELDKLLAVLRDKNVPTDYYAEPATYSAIAAEFPSYATFTERHPGQVVMIILPILLVVIVGIALLVTFA